MGTVGPSGEPGVGGTAPVATAQSAKKSWLLIVAMSVAAILVALNQTGLFKVTEKSPPPNSLRAKVHRVKELPANSQDWFDTEIDVASGQLLEITASGQINLWGGRPDTNSSPDGNPNFPCDFPGCVERGQPAGKLYGKIGNNRPFAIGTKTTYNVGSGGRLQLKVNDHFFDDNSGKFTVTIELR
jgi:hypothetical protein